MPTEKKSEKSDKKPETVDTKNDTGQNIATIGFAIAIASIITNFFTLGIMAVVGLALSIIGRVQTSRAGHPSGLALAGIIISGIVMFLTFAAFIFFVMLAIFSAGTNCSTSQTQDHLACKSTGTRGYQSTQDYGAGL